jgi:hypothetical protein
VGVLGLGGLHADLLALDVVDALDLFLAVHVAQAHGQQPQHLRALHRVLHHVAERGGDGRVGQHLLQVVLVAEQEVQREHAGLGRQRGRVGGRRDHEVDVAGAQLLQHLRLLAELRARELVDAEVAARQLLELGVEDIGGDPVRRGGRLVVGETERALLRQHLWRRGAQRGAGHGGQPHAARRGHGGKAGWHACLLLL